MAADRARARRALDIVGAIAALIAIAGLFFARSLIVLWAFLLLFGLTTVPDVCSAVCASEGGDDGDGRAGAGRAGPPTAVATRGVVSVGAARFFSDAGAAAITALESDSSSRAPPLVVSLCRLIPVAAPDRHPP